jgi:hypothetical protein
MFRVPKFGICQIQLVSSYHVVVNLLFSVLYKNVINMYEHVTCCLSHVDTG